MRLILAAGLVLAAASFGPVWAQEAWNQPGEDAVEPYTPGAANAGGTPRTDTAVFQAFHGREGIDRIVADTVAAAAADPRTAEIFKPFNLARLRRTLSEQICYLLGGGCEYTGRDMKTAHKDMGLQATDLNILVEHLQGAMDREKVPFGAQNKLLARLAPMKRDIVER